MTLQTALLNGKKDEVVIDTACEMVAKTTFTLYAKGGVDIFTTIEKGDVLVINDAPPKYHKLLIGFARASMLAPYKTVNGVKADRLDMTPKEAVKEIVKEIVDGDASNKVVPLVRDKLLKESKKPTKVRRKRKRLSKSELKVKMAKRKARGR